MSLEGIDVSAYQGAIDWNAVAAARIAFALVKVSEGNGFEDPRWAANAAALAAPGPIVPGAYHFARPDLDNTPEAEADWFWARLTARVPDVRSWLLALDLEVGSGDLAAWRDRWCARIATLAAGYLPGWYSFWNFALGAGLNAATPYWGWFAWPDANGALPPAAFSVAMQQYGVRVVPGIQGPVDANRFFGSLDELRTRTLGGTTTPASSASEGTMIELPDGSVVHRVFCADDPKTRQPPFYTVHWSLFPGAEGQEEAGGGRDVDLGGLIRAGTLYAYLRDFDGVRRLVVGGLGPDGAPQRIILNSVDQSLPRIEPWTELPMGVPVAMPQGVPGPIGPAGPPGPDITDDHIAQVATAEVARRLSVPS